MIGLINQNKRITFINLILNTTSYSPYPIKLIGNTLDNFTYFLTIKMKLCTQDLITYLKSMIIKLMITNTVKNYSKEQIMKIKLKINILVYLNFSIDQKETGTQ